MFKRDTCSGRFILATLVLSSALGDPRVFLSWSELSAEHEEDSLSLLQKEIASHSAFREFQPSPSQHADFVQNEWLGVLETEAGPAVMTPIPDDAPHYFRRVSVTLICVIALNFLSLWMYVALTLGRSVDDLAGFTLPSQFSNVCITAARSMGYPPMIGCLCVAYRLRVLRETDGLGEPHILGQYSMIAATFGLYLQYCIVALTPFFASSKDENTFAETSGGSYDVHPRLLRYKWPFERMRIMFFGLLVVALVAIYTGTFGILCGVMTYGTDGPDVHGIATAMLVIVYMLTRLAVLCTPTAPKQPQEVTDGSPLDEHQPGKEYYPWQCATLSMCMALEKAPVLCILLLMTFLRYMELDVWRGRPPGDVSLLFVAATYAIAAETTVAGVIGWLGTAERGYVGIYVITCPWKFLHILQQMFNFLLGIIVCWITSLVGHTLFEDTGASFRATSLIILIFFFVQGGLYMTMLLKQVFKSEWQVMQTMFISASISIRFTPVLCCLFLVTRLRVLQLTNGSGEPQHWAQESMYAAAVLSALQVLCCTAAPLLTGNKSHFDDDGHATYDMGPQLGAYILTLVKYLVISGIITCCGVVGVAAVIITPSTAEACTSQVDGPPIGCTPLQISHAGKELGSLTVLLVIVFVLSSAKVVGKGVQILVEANPKICMKVGSASLNIFTGYVNLRGITVLNPIRKPPFECPWLLQVDNVVVKIYMWQLIRSRFKMIELDTIALKGIRVVVEKDFNGTSSNVALLANRLSPQSKQFMKACVPCEQKVKSVAKIAKTTMIGEQPTSHQEEPEMKVIVHTLDIRDFAAGINTGEKNIDFDIELPAQKFDDFAKESKEPHEVVSRIMGVLMSAVLSSPHLLKKAIWTTLTLPCPKLRSSCSNEEEAKQPEASKYQEVVDAVGIAS